MIGRGRFCLIVNVIVITLLIEECRSIPYNKQQINSETSKKIKYISSDWFKSRNFHPLKSTKIIPAAISPRNVQDPKRNTVPSKTLSSKTAPSSSLSSTLSDPSSRSSQTDRDTRVGTSITQTAQTDKDSGLEHDRSVYYGENYMLEFVSECDLPTAIGNFRLRGYRCTIFESEPSENTTKEINPNRRRDRRIKEIIEPSVIYCGSIRDCSNVLVRVHDQCQTSEVMGSLRCDCKQQLDAAMNSIHRHKCRAEECNNEVVNIDMTSEAIEANEINNISNGGAILYLPQEGRGIGLANKIACYNLQDQGYDTVDANKLLGFDVELRNYDYVPDILNDISIKSIILLTNNPFKVNRLQQLGVKINDTRGLHIRPQKYNFEYLKAKQFRMQHKLNFDETTGEYKSLEDMMLRQDLLPKEIEQNTEKIGRASAKEDGSHQNMNKGKGERGEVQKKDNSQKDKESNYCYGKQSVVDAIKAIKNGEMVLVVDDENRENEGDLIMAAEKVTPEAIAFIIRYSSGILCVAMEEERLEELNLPPMVTNNEDPKCTAFTVSVDCKHNTTSGISASDRSKTFQELANPNAKATDFTRPGHVFPLRARKGGVLERCGHTEATIDLMKMAKLYPAGVLCEVVDPSEDGLLSDFKGRSMARRGSLKEFAKKHKLVLTSIADLVSYRRECNI